MKTIFRIVGILEGISYLLLMSLGLYYKYALNDPSFVKLFGMPHGLLFMLYIVLAIVIKPMMNWNYKTLFIVFLGSIIPFGTFYVDWKYFKK
jgi:integral membrane protein